VAAVVSRFADRRAAVAQVIDASTRAAMNQQIAIEEANELARLAAEHAAEKRQIKRHVLINIKSKHRELRRRRRQSHRHQRIAVGIQLHRIVPTRRRTNATPTVTTRIRSRTGLRSPTSV